MEKKHDKLPHGQRLEARISGDISQERKGELLRTHTEIFQGDHSWLGFSSTEWEKLKESEYEKGPRELKFIATANTLINTAIQECGAVPFDIPEDSVLFVEEAFYNENFNPNWFGVYLPDVQKIVVRGRPDDCFARKMLTVVHEMIHAKESVSLYATANLVKFKKRGVTSTTRKNGESESTKATHLGIGLNEALVARMEKKIFSKLFLESDLFMHERLWSDENKDAVADLSSRLGVALGDLYVVKPFGEKERIFSHSYFEPRQVLEYILATVSSAMDTPLSEAEKIMNAAYFTGDLALRAQIKVSIEKIFGKGAFQKIMDMQPDKDSAKETLEFLKERRLEINKQQTNMSEKKPIIKTPASDNPYEVFLSPEKLAEKRAKQAELARAEVAEQSQEEVEQPQQLVTTTEESMEETKSETIVREQTVADAESFTPEEKKMTATEMREAREREEEGIAALAQDLFEKRMQGHGAEMVDTILVENGITPWTPEAEEFMRKWDWEQAAAKLAPIEQDRQAAIEQVNGIEPKKLIELSEKEEGVIAVQLAQFNMQPADLEQISGFDTLSYGQRLLVIENLRQATLGRIQEEATDKHRAEVAGAAWYGKIWRNAFSKLRIAKHEKETAQEIMQGGLAHHREVLAQLTTGAENMGLDVLVEKDGSLTVQYLGKNELLSPAEQEQVAKFNTAAQKFSTVPAEWSFAPEGSKEYKEYKKAFQEFDQFKRTLLATEGNIFGEKNAMHAMSNADFKIRSNQFFNTHPDAMKELVAIKSDAIWARGLGDMFKERGAQTAVGFIGRTIGINVMAKAAALPIVGGAIGMFMAHKRAKESLHTQERQMRGGKNVDARFADMMYTTVPATTLGEKLERALHAVSTSEPDSEQHKKALATLRARLEYSQFKLEEGRIDFGSREVHTGNQYDLFDKIGAGFALLEQTAITDELESEEKAGKRFNRLDKMFTAEQNTVEDLRRIYKNKEMLKGIAIGATFSIVGYLIADTLAGTGNAHAATGPESVSAIKKSINLTGEPGAHTARVNGVAGAVGKVAALSSVGEKVGGGVANVAATESASLNFVEGGNIAAAMSEQGEINSTGTIGKVAALSSAGEQASAVAAESAPLNFVEGGNIAATQETIPTVAAIGARGAEGSIIDTLKTNPELAKKLGWDGVTDLKEWSGKEAHALWLADAKEQLAKPEMIEKLKNAGYTPDIKGYTEAMSRIAKGAVEFNPTTKTIDLENVEFLKAGASKGIASVVSERPAEVAAQIVEGYEAGAIPVAVPPVEVAAQIVEGHEAGVAPVATPLVEVAPQIVGGSAVETVTAPTPTAEAELTKTEAVTSAPVNKEAVVAPKSPVVAQEPVATPTSEILHSSAPIVNPERIALLEANINTDRTNAASHIVDHYKAGDITAQDFTAYYAGMVNGVRNDEQTITRVQQLFQDVIAEASPEIKTNAMGELTKIVKQLQKT